MDFLKHNILTLTIIPLLILFVGASYVRFVILYDYTVAYESDCDPLTASCFIGCEDEECTEQYYYKLMSKNAKNLHAQCGSDITDCEAATYCLAEEALTCQETYCDSENGDECSVPGTVDITISMDL
jgi:hypothetical protein